MLYVEIVSEVVDIVTNCWTLKNPYTDLKTRLVVYIYIESSEKKLRKLLKELDHGDKKSPALFGEMLRLAESKVSDEVLRNLFFDQQR